MIAPETDNEAPAISWCGTRNNSVQWLDSKQLLHTWKCHATHKLVGYTRWICISCIYLFVYVCMCVCRHPFLHIFPSIIITVSSIHGLSPFASFHPGYSQNPRTLMVNFDETPPCNETCSPCSHQCWAHILVTFRLPFPYCFILRSGPLSVQLSFMSFHQCLLPSHHYMAYVHGCMLSSFVLFHLDRMLQLKHLPTNDNMFAGLTSMLGKHPCCCCR